MSNVQLSSFIEREAVRMWPSPEQRKRSLSQLGKFMEFRGNASRPLTQFLPRDVHDFTDQLIASGSSEATVNRYMSAISKVFTHALDERVTTVPMKLKYFAERNGRPRVFSANEISQVIAYCDDNGWTWLKDMFVLALKTGMRKGEVLALGEGAATISDCGNWVVLPAEVTKTGVERFVPIKNAEANKAARRLYNGLSDYTKKRFDYRWGRIQRDVGRNDKHFVFHVTRHTAATRMANDLAVNTVVIARYLGHASLKTTQKYVKAKPDTLLDISAQM
jgi:integrase